MTKKDYILISKCIKNQVACSNIANINTLKYLAEDLAEELEKENILFSKERFLIACGINK